MISEAPPCGGARCLSQEKHDAGSPRLDSLLPPAALPLAASLVLHMYTSDYLCTCARKDALSMLPAAVLGLRRGV